MNIEHYLELYKLREYIVILLVHIDNIYSYFFVQIYAANVNNYSEKTVVNGIMMNIYYMTSV